MKPYCWSRFCSSGWSGFCKQNPEETKSGAIRTKREEQNRDQAQFMLDPKLGERVDEAD